MQDGITTKFGAEDRMWCCQTTEDQCLGEEDEDGNLIKVTCNGTASSLSDQCHEKSYDDPSCNYYPLDKFRYSNAFPEIYRSYLDLCQDNR